YHEDAGEQHPDRVDRDRVRQRADLGRSHARSLGAPGRAFIVPVSKIRPPCFSLRSICQDQRVATPLRDAEAHAERLFALSQALPGAGDAAGRLRWVNAAWERTMGWTADELYSRPYLEFVHPDDRGKVAAFAEHLQHLPPGESRQLETRARRSDGSYRWLRV